VVSVASNKIYDHAKTDQEVFSPKPFSAVGITIAELMVPCDGIPITKLSLALGIPEAELIVSKES
jgi:hypothetical protein